MTSPIRTGIDVIATTAEGAPPTADRVFTTEVWYPASADTAPGSTYAAFLRDGVTQVELTGIAARDAAPAEGRFPSCCCRTAIPATGS